MSDLKFCPDCGAKLLPDDRFCGDCGFDTQLMEAESPSQSPSSRPPQQQTAVPSPPSSQVPPATASSSAATPSQLTASTPPLVVVTPPPATGAASSPPLPPASEPPLSSGRNPGSATGDLGRGSGSNKNALLIMITLLALLFLGGGMVYWWLSKGENPDPGSVFPPPGIQTNRSATPAQSDSIEQPAPTPAVDLSRAATYLSEPGLKCTFFVNYPDGTAGVVERTSAKVVSHPAVRVSEVETGVEQGEAFGYGFHYVERPDGTYYILDQTPDEIFPVLKNNLTVGQTWKYQDEFGQITWTVMDMGVNLDLGFTVIENCLILHEVNQMVDYQSLTYYAPGRGMVAVRNPNGKDDFYKLTALTKIDAEQAAAVVKRWSPSYAIIKDDRTQN